MQCLYPGRGEHGLVYIQGEESTELVGDVLPFPICISLFSNLSSGIITVNQRSILRMNRRQPKKGLRNDIDGKHPIANGRDGRSQLGKGWEEMPPR